jgi:hypothetical protein
MIGCVLVLLVIIEASILMDNRTRFIQTLYRCSYDYYEDWEFFRSIRHSPEYGLISFEDYMEKHPVPWIFTGRAKTIWVARFLRVFPELKPYLIHL